MSLGLPDFGSRGAHGSVSRLLRTVQGLGLAALAFTLFNLALQAQLAYSERASLDRARAEVARSNNTAEDIRRRVAKNADILAATASVESAPERAMMDLDAILPNGVSIPALRIEYTQEGAARIEITVVARTAIAYDQFLAALSHSPRFGDIRPGSEVRPGLVRATVLATHLPGPVAR